MFYSSQKNKNEYTVLYVSYTRLYYVLLRVGVLCMLILVFCVLYVCKLCTSSRKGVSCNIIIHVNMLCLKTYNNLHTCVSEHV